MGNACGSMTEKVDVVPNKKEFDTKSHKLINKKISNESIKDSKPTIQEKSRIEAIKKEKNSEMPLIMKQNNSDAKDIVMKSVNSSTNDKISQKALTKSYKDKSVIVLGSNQDSIDDKNNLMKSESLKNDKMDQKPNVDLNVTNKTKHMTEYLNDHHDDAKIVEEDDTLTYTAMQEMNDLAEKPIICDKTSFIDNSNAIEEDCDSFIQLQDKVNKMIKVIDDTSSSDTTTLKDDLKGNVERMNESLTNEEFHYEKGKINDANIEEMNQYESMANQEQNMDDNQFSHHNHQHHAYCYNNHHHHHHNLAHGSIPMWYYYNYYGNYYNENANNHNLSHLPLEDQIQMMNCTNGQLVWYQGQPVSSWYNNLYQNNPMGKFNEFETYDKMDNQDQYHKPNMTKSMMMMRDAKENDEMTMMAN